MSFATISKFPALKTLITLGMNRVIVFLLISGPIRLPSSTPQEDAVPRSDTTGHSSSDEFHMAPWWDPVSMQAKMASGVVNVQLEPWEEMQEFCFQHPLPHCGRNINGT